MVVSAGYEQVYALVEKARLAKPVDTKALEDIRDTYGYDLYIEAMAEVLVKHSYGWLLAERLNDFYRDYDFYDYMDSVGNFEDQEEVIGEIAEQLTDFETVQGILVALKEIYKEIEIGDGQRLVVEELVLDLDAVHQRLGKSVPDLIEEAEQRSCFSEGAGCATPLSELGTRGGAIEFR